MISKLPDSVIETLRQLKDNTDKEKWVMVDTLAEIFEEFNPKEDDETRSNYLSQLAYELDESKASLDKMERVGRHWPKELRSMFEPLTFSHFEKLGNDYEMAYRALNWASLDPTGEATRHASVRLVEQWKRDKDSETPDYLRKLKGLYSNFLKAMATMDMPEDYREAVKHGFKTIGKHGVWDKVKPK